MSTQENFKKKLRPRKKERPIRFELRMRPSEYRELADLADEDERSMASMLRWLVSQEKRRREQG